MKAAKHLIAVLAISVSAAACAGAGSSKKLAPELMTRVEVTNNNWSDMVVYAVRNGMRIRLGTVTSMQTQRFRLPETMSGSGTPVSLVADPIGSQDVYQTGRITFMPGQRITLQIQNHLAISSYAVWGQ